MTIDIKVPSVGESITEALLAEWFRVDGDMVEKDEALFVIETDKVTLEVTAEATGKLKIDVPADETVKIGAVVGRIITDGAGVAEKTSSEPAKTAEKTEETPFKPAEAEKPVLAENMATDSKPKEKAETRPDLSSQKSARSDKSGKILSPSVRQLVAEKNINVDQIDGTGPGGRITRSDVWLYLEQNASAAADDCFPQEATEADLTTREKMSPIRRRIAERLLAARQGTAMLTTFNEIDMSRAMDIRKTYKEAFQKKHDISLGFMSFFAAACCHALREVPAVNAYVEGDDIVYHDYVNLGIAIGSGKGLVVPVIRRAGKMGFAELEKAIVGYVQKIKSNKLSLDDLEGGTFTISNGGVYGSLLSTPILNSPQSGILGMHKIEKRPVVINDEIVIRPMMYVALSYDHRVVDGKGAVTCLKRIKELVENPERMLMEV